MNDPSWAARFWIRASTSGLPSSANVKNLTGSCSATAFTSGKACSFIFATSASAALQRVCRCICIP